MRLLFPRQCAYLVCVVFVPLPKNAGIKYILPSDRSASWLLQSLGYLESHEYSGKAPDLAPLPLINIHTDIYYILLQTLKYGVLKL